MERQYVDPAELELRRDPDFLRSLNMVDEGAPVYDAADEYKMIMKKLKSIKQMRGYSKPPRPRKCG